MPEADTVLRFDNRRYTIFVEGGFYVEPAEGGRT
jgi:hypothetical protein